MMTCERFLALDGSWILGTEPILILPGQRWLEFSRADVLFKIREESCQSSGIILSPNTETPKGVLLNVLFVDLRKCFHPINRFRILLVHYRCKAKLLRELCQQKLVQSSDSDVSRGIRVMVCMLPAPSSLLLRAYQLSKTEVGERRWKGKD